MKSNNKKPPVKNGRPTRYLVAYNKRAKRLALLGCTDAQIAASFEVSEQTINSWKQKFPKFLESLKKGRVDADGKVVRSLYERATGYSHPDTHFTVIDEEVIATPTTKHYPPDTSACIFWLKNRRPDLWRDVQRHEHSGPGGGAVQVEHMSAEDLRKDMIARGELDDKGRFMPARN